MRNVTNALNKLEYYYENEAEEYLFYKVPQMLFTDKRFSKISSEIAFENESLSIPSAGQIRGTLMV